MVQRKPTIKMTQNAIVAYLLWPLDFSFNTRLHSRMPSGISAQSKITPITNNRLDRRDFVRKQ